MAAGRGERVAVVGGGIVGLSVAYHLAEAGVEDVVVFERDGVATKASGRAAGHLLAHELGPDVSAYCRSFHERLERDHDTVVHYEPNAYTLAHTEAGRERLAERHANEPADTELLSGAEFADREPDVAADDVTAAFTYGTGLHTDPYSTTIALLEEAEALGVTLRRTGVTDLTVTDDGFTVTTDDGTAEASVVVAAAGAWSRGVAELVGVELALRPRPSEIAVFEPEVELDFPLLYCPDLDLYAHQEPNGDLLVGAGRNTEIDDLDGFSTRATESFLQTVAEKGERITPHLPSAGLVNDWAGRCSATPDRVPLIGETEVPGFYVAAGMNGAGIANSPFAGRLTADLVTGRDSRFDAEPYDPGRFEDGSFEIKNSIEW